MFKKKIDTHIYLDEKKIFQMSLDIEPRNAEKSDIK